MKKFTFLKYFWLLVVISFISVSISFSDTAQNELDSIYKQYLETRDNIFKQSDDTNVGIDDQLKLLTEFTDKTEPLVASDEGKVFLAILKSDLSYRLVIEAHKKIQPEKDHPHLSFVEKLEKYVNNIVNNAQKDLEETFSKVDLPDNSYLMLLFHSQTIKLANMELHVIDKKMPKDVLEHCDAIMNGPLFKEPLDIILPPFKLSNLGDFYKLSKFKKNVIMIVREYLYNSKKTEFAISAIQSGKGYSKEITDGMYALKNQIFYSSYPLYKYPFLKEFLEITEK